MDWVNISIYVQLCEAHNYIDVEYVLVFRYRYTHIYYVCVYCRRKSFFCLTTNKICQNSILIIHYSYIQKKPKYYNNIYIYIMIW